MIMEAVLNGTKLEKHTISLYTSNKPGVLIRIALVFARRGYNIDSLVVSAAHNPDFARFTIVASGDKQTLDQILKQLNKLVDVIEAKDETGEDVIHREMALVKIQCNKENRAEVLQVADAFKSDVVDIGDSTVTIMTTGKSPKMESINSVFDKYGVMEVVRSGKLLIARGDKVI
jgi:acetolactate synthase I/III small subunit